MKIVIVNTSNLDVDIMRPVFGDTVRLKPRQKVVVEGRRVDLPYYKEAFKVFGVTAYEEKQPIRKQVLNEETPVEETPAEAPAEEAPKKTTKTTRTRKTVSL